ncbi:MAG: TIGR01212 family radical SAM protein [Lachnospiraceae bacterium]|nr:TIGR01212 family radical SAM protein [Lachnospiraceae bacterium]
MRYLNDYLRETFGEKVYKLSLSSGCTCPNRDGTLGYGGCTFCSEGGSGEFAAAPAPLAEQIAEAKARVCGKTDAKAFIAYFQSYTNTYGDLARLESLYREALSHEEIAALSLGTRPDCLGEDVIAMLERLTADSNKPVWIELGLQTIHEKTAARIHRGYPLAVFEDAYRRLKDAGIPVIVHVIFNLPGETREEMLQTVRYLANLTPELDGIKLQMLQILRGTRMAEEYTAEPFPLMDLAEYAELIAEAVRILPKNTVLHRITGDGPRKMLIAPLWCLDKKHVLNTLHAAIGESCS